MGSSASLRRLLRRLLSMSMRAAALSLLTAMLLLRVVDPLPVEVLRLRTFDLYQILHPRLTAERPAVIVDIDDESLAALGQWPWPRTTMAKLVDKLVAAGAKVVVLDVLFAEPDRLSPGTIADSLGALTDDAVALLKTLPSNDAVLARALEGRPVVLGMPAIERTLTNTHESPNHLPGFAQIGGDARAYLLRYPAAIHNLPELEQAASGLGVSTLGPENDNVVRRVPAAYLIGDRIRPSLIVEALRVESGSSNLALRVDDAGVLGVVAGRQFVPTDRNGRIWVHFAPRSHDRSIRSVDVLSGAMDPALVRGKYVFVGSSAAGLHDLKATPIAGNMPGVEVHVQMMEMVAAGQALVRPNYSLGAELVVFLATGILIIWLVPRVGPWWTLAVGGVLAACLVGGSWYLFVREGLLIDVSFAAASAFVLYFVLTFLNYLRGEGERRRVRDAFAHYLAPALVSELAREPSQLRLGGEEREMTLLFTDVQGFTQISETYDAVGLTNLVNRILNPITKAILDAEGTVDKYMGDAVMAFWNAPLPDAEHARHACQAALAIAGLMEPVNEAILAENADRAHPPVKVGVGINTGPCCVGNMGSDLRFNYSVIGDTVNIASRLEGLTRTYKVPVVVGESTYDLVPDLALIELDRVTVVGKTIPVGVYALLGDETVAASAGFRSLVAAHARLLAAYRARDWPEAQRRIAECRRHAGPFELGGLYDVYEERVRFMTEFPPSEDWDGVFIATSKA